jgi:Protein of unknown function (DUF3237)
MALELVPLCGVDIDCSEPIIVGEGPSGLRVVVETLSMRFTGDRLRAEMKGQAGGDWLTLNGSVATMDVRATIETHDGALVYVQYKGRSDFSGGPGAAPIFVSPTFETGDERYAWLNLIQGAGVGTLSGTDLHYDWYELRQS